MAALYAFWTLDVSFLMGGGPFWANPRGPWLMDATGTIENVDGLDLITGYRGFLGTPWAIPPFFVPNLGTPEGTNIVFVDSIPLVALLGKLASGLMGAPVNPYGLWVGACFVLSAVFASLLMVEAGQRSLLATVAASIFVVSAPILLWRLGHFALMGQFLVIGTLLLYLHDPRVTSPGRRGAMWAGWLCLVLMINIYLWVMAGAIYVATVLRRRDATGASLRAVLREPVVVGGVLLLVMVAAGHLGRGGGSHPFAGGYGELSMNLASPFWPQQSGLFPGLGGVIDATRGQYEGFNYLGFGGLLVVAGGAIAARRRLGELARRHRWLCAALAALVLFAVSHRVFLWDLKLLDLDFGWRGWRLPGVFRSSGRMFWPAYYALLLFGLVLVLRRFRRGPAVGFVLACCLLQLLDTEPMRERLARLSRHDVPTLLDLAEWQDRMRQAARVEVGPTYLCGARMHEVPNLELQLAAMTAGRPINSVYNPRKREDCAAQAAALRNGPWREDTLYVFLTGGAQGVPAGWAPPGLSCHAFAQGVWCLGLAPLSGFEPPPSRGVREKANAG